MKITKQELDAALVTEIESGGNTKPGEVITETLSSRVPVTVNAPGATPASIGEFEGDTVINYAPLFDSGLWVFHANIVVNSPNKVTLNATATSQYSILTINVKKNTDYNITKKGNGQVGVFDSVGGGNLAPYSSADKVTFNTGELDLIRIYLSNASLGTGTYVWEDLSLSEGTVAQEFVANVKGVTNPTIENTTTGDSLTVVGTFHAGDIVDVENKKVTRAKREVVLDGSLTMVFNTDFVGFKAITITLPVNYPLPFVREVVKYNGKLLSTGIIDKADINSGDAQNTNKLTISIADVDSGWGDSYTPTAVEIKAYFNGWKMYNGDTNPNGDGVYNGTGTKYFAYRFDTGAYQGSSSPAGVVPTTQAPINSKWQPYRLLYDLATPVTESIETIGSLRLASGDNTVELTEGRIVRERVTKLERSDVYGVYFLNGYGAPSVNKIKSILEIRKNGLVDKLWTIDKSAQSNLPIRGEELAFIPISDYDPTAIYEVSYIPQEPYKVSAHTNPVTINYRDTLGGATEELVEGVASLESRVSGQQSVINTSLVKIGETREELLAAIAEGGGGGGDGYEFIAKVDTLNSTAMASFSPSSQYDKLRLDFNAVGFSEAGTRYLVLYINGVTDVNAYSGNKIVGTTTSAVNNYAVQTSGVANNQLVTGSVYLERRGTGEGTTNEGLIFVEGATSIAQKGSFTGASIEFHRGGLKQNRSIISLMVGWAATGTFNAGNIELWGVPK